MTFFRSRASERRPRANARRALEMLLAAAPAVCAGTGCSAPPSDPIDPDALANEVDARASSPDELAQAMEAADPGALPPDALPIPRPRAPSQLDPASDEFWQACAYAWHPDVRAARRALLAARARHGSAGRPGPIGLEAETSGGDESELSLTFDLLGLVGLGRAGAARELAGADELLALAELERAVWSARFDVDRARVRLAAAREREAALLGLLAEAETDRRRIEILRERGWVPPADAARALAAFHEIEHHLTDARAGVARARAELARAAGLPADHPALDGVGSESIEVVLAEPSEREPPAPAEWIRVQPELRARRAAHVLADAHVRAEAAERWPGVRLGPRVVFADGSDSLGGLVEVELPFPGSVDGRVAAAVEERTAAREQLVDALVDVLARARSQRETLALRSEELATHLVPTERAMAGMWRATAATFRVDPAAMNRWSFDLIEWVHPLLAVPDGREATALASLELAETCGPAADRGEEPRP